MNLATDILSTAIYEVTFSDGIDATLTVRAACDICREEGISAQVFNADGRVIFECGRDGYAYAA